MITKIKEKKFIKNGSVVANYLKTNDEYLYDLIRGLSNIDKVVDGEEVEVIECFMIDDNDQYAYAIVKCDKGMFIVREDNIDAIEEAEDTLYKYGFEKIIHNGAKTILVTDSGEKFITTKAKGDRSDIEKAVMMVLLKAEGYKVSDIYTIVDLAKKTKK